MNYVYASITCITVLFLISSISYAFATPVAQFDPNLFVVGHSSIISCTDCGTGTASTLNLSINSGSTTISTFTVKKISGTTNNYLSDPITFVTGTPSTNQFGPVNPTSTSPVIVTANVTISGTSSVTTTATIKVNFSSLGAIGTGEYKINKLGIFKEVAQACNSGNSEIGGDFDSDGICDNWENSTTFGSNQYCNNGNGLCVRTSTTSSAYKLDCNPNSLDWKDVCPTVGNKDIYVEIDYMTGHKPTDSVLNHIFLAFAKSGFTLHIQLDEEVHHVNTILSGGGSTSPGFDQMKSFWFGTSSERGLASDGLQNTFPKMDMNSNWYKQHGIRVMKGQVFHYAMLVHFLNGCTTLSVKCSSGVSEPSGNDSQISLGAFYNMVGSLDQQEGTLLHELGHPLGLKHGGNEAKNCKPNYLSVMSYTRQFSDFTNRVLEFSRNNTPSQILENNLPTTIGSYISGNEGEIVYNTPAGVKKWTTGSSSNIDWGNVTSFNVNGVITDCGEGNASTPPESVAYSAVNDTTVIVPAARDSSDWGAD